MTESLSRSDSYSDLPGFIPEPVNPVLPSAEPDASPTAAEESAPPTLSPERVTVLEPTDAKEAPQGWFDWTKGMATWAAQGAWTLAKNTVTFTKDVVSKSGTRVEAHGFGFARPGMNLVNPDHLLESMAGFNAQLDESGATLPAIPEPELAGAPVPAEDLSLEEQAEIDQLFTELTRIENEEKTRLLTNLTNYTSFRIFHESILKNTLDGEESSLTHYNQFVCSGTPNAAFYAQYGFWKGLLARILLPIIQWIVGLIFSIRSQKAGGGVWGIKEKVCDYLKNPATVRREAGTVLQHISEYFHKLHVIYTDFATGAAGTQTLDQYIRSRLDEDLVTSGRSRTQLYQDLNRWIVDLIEIKTGTPLFGGMLDNLISTFLTPVLNRARLVEQAFATSLGTSSTPNPAFLYNLQRLVLNKFKEFNEKLRNLDNKLTTNSQAEDEPERHLSLSLEEKARVQTLYQRLVAILPYQGKNEEDIASVHAAEQNPSRGKSAYERVEGLVVDWQQEIAESLEGPLNDLFALLYGEFSKQDTCMELWTDSLKAANSLFSTENQRTYTPEDLDQISIELDRELTTFTDVLLDRQFKVEARRKTRMERQDAIEAEFEKTRDQLSTQLRELNEVKERLTNVNPSSQPDLANRLLHQMHRQLRGLFTTCYNRLQDCKNQPHLNHWAKGTFATQIQEIHLQTIEMLNAFNTLKDQIASAIASTATRSLITALDPNGIETTQALLTQLEADAAAGRDVEWTREQVQQIHQLQTQGAEIAVPLARLEQLLAAEPADQHTLIMNVLGEPNELLRPLKRTILISLGLIETHENPDAALGAEIELPYDAPIMAQRLQGQHQGRLRTALTAMQTAHRAAFSRCRADYTRIISVLKNDTNMQQLVAFQSREAQIRRITTAADKTEAMIPRLEKPAVYSLDLGHTLLAKLEKKRVKSVINTMTTALQIFFKDPRNWEYMLLGNISDITRRA